MTTLDTPRRGAAFFDLDRTLIAGASTFAFGWVAFRNGLLSTRAVLGDAMTAVNFAITGGSDEQSDFVRDRILEAVKGKARDELTSLNDDLLPRLLNSVRPETRRVVERHREAGRDTYIVSASPIELVEPLASALGMTGAIATESEVVDGVYTGRLLSEFCYGIGKVHRVRDLSADKGYDLALSYAYSDSKSDLPLLEMVGHPVAVNPDGTLKRIARSRNWPMVQFARKAKMTVTAVSAGAAVVGVGLGSYVLGRSHERRSG